jgi:choline-glycine betaine transporter
VEFTPRNLGTGYVTLAASGLLLVWSGIELVNGGMDRNQTILFIIIAVLGLVLLFQSTAGIRKLLRRRNSRS